MLLQISFLRAGSAAEHCCAKALRKIAAEGWQPRALLWSSSVCLGEARLLSCLAFHSAEERGSCLPSAEPSSRVPRAQPNPPQTARVRGHSASLPSQNLRKRLALQEDAEERWINRAFQPTLLLPGGRTGYSQSVYCWSWANSVGLSEIHMPSLIFGQQGCSGGPTSC